MPSQAMEQLIAGFRERQKANAGRATPPLEELRAGFAPAGATDNAKCGRSS